MNSTSGNNLSTRFFKYLGALPGNPLQNVLNDAGNFQNIGDIYVGGSEVLSHDAITIIGSLDMSTYLPSSGPCPRAGQEETDVINALAPVVGRRATRKKRKKK
jgi:hypothetical protein